MGPTALGQAEATAGAQAKRVDLSVAVPAVLLLPALVLFVVLFVVPFGTLILHSLYGYSRLTGIVYELGGGNYERIWLDSYYIAAILQTLKQSLLVSVSTLLVGYPIALFITRASPRHRGWVIMLVLSPLLVSVVVRSFGWLIILGPGGLLDSVLRSVAIEGGALLHSEVAVIIGLTNVLLPFMVLSVAAALQRVDPAVPLAAASLGASPIHVLWNVTLPLSLPGILAGVLIVFSLSSSSFVTPALLGGARYNVLSTSIYEQVLILQNWPFGAALAVALVVIVVAILMAQTRVIEYGRYRVVFQ